MVSASAADAADSAAADTPCPRQRRAVVVVFARLPVPGQVKTRLAAGIGPEAAAGFYRLCAEHACREVMRCSAADGVVYCASAEDVQGVAAWLVGAGCASLPVRPQVQDPDLGRRMIAALTAAAVGGTAAGCGGDAAAPPTSQQQQPQQQQLQPQYDAAIVIGTDIPDVSSEVLCAAVAALLADERETPCSAGDSPPPQQQQEQDGNTTAAAAADMVLGPAADGGYYLLGFRTPALLRREVQDCSVFEGVQWSSPSVLQRTLEAASRNVPGLRAAAAGTLPTLQDIDTAQDAAAWLVASESGGGASRGGSSLGVLRQFLLHQQL